MLGNWIRKHPRKTGGIVLLLVGLLWYGLALPKVLFDTPTSMVLEAADGQLLGARIAEDGQWRFPEIDSVPYKFQVALVEFEDRRFYRHGGVDLRAIGRALRQNIRAGEIVSGGSTLSMQVMRLARQKGSRNLWQKLIETILATRLELRYSKEEILALYASHAPFGGNVVGLETASWRYFGKSPELLSWAEAATLAVLPNSPGLIHPGRNRQALLEKRNRLLDRLVAAGQIELLDAQLAKEEPLPQEPLPLPQLAPHLLHRAERELTKGDPSKQSRLVSTLDPALQARVNELAGFHLEQISQNGIHNIGVVVAEVNSGQVRAYLGNAPQTGSEHQEWVDVVQAHRSTGSILKPLLFARMIETGLITPETLIPDLPTYINGYKPENFSLSYDGAVPARRALIRSLNVPFVRMLRQYGLPKFHFDLQQMGISGLQANPDHYGLTLILGGAEASLWELCSIYGAMARTLNSFQQRSGEYDPAEYRPLVYVAPENPVAPKLVPQPPILSAAAIWQTFSCMQEVERPDSEGDWRQFSSSRQIAWKTGTSFGYRDAWAIGIDGQHLVGVWVGNADGEGRPGLVGVRAAAPLLFAIFDQLPPAEWFSAPADELRPLSICATSGYLPSPYCPLDTVLAPRTVRTMQPCPYHERVHLDPVSGKLVNSSCADPREWQAMTWFVLPPGMEYYYRNNHPEYAPLPPYREDCVVSTSENPLELIYPRPNARISIPIDLDGNPSATIFRAAHRRPETEIHWHLDATFYGTTQTFHEMEFNPGPGKHRLTLVDSEGHRLEQEFEIISE
jgi:penicillin-binding protein 1C